MNELKKIRKEINITQEEAAIVLGVSRRTYQKYENTECKNTLLMFYCNLLKEKFKVTEETGILTIDKITDKVKKVFDKYDVSYAYLFGSYAKNKAKGNSDIDILISSTITGLDFFGLIEELRCELCKKIDLLNIGQLINNEELLNEILKDGIKIYG